MPPLGYRGNAAWRDMSEYAVHFTKDSEENEAYNVMKQILREGRINPSGPFGAATNLVEQGDLTDSQDSACFSEIPLDLLDRLIARRSLYGIGFHQEVLIDKGGGRVWYLDRDGTQAEAFKLVVRESMLGGINEDDPIWKVTPLVDYPGDYGATQYRFEWEREWRVPRGLTFTTDDVAFLFLPEDLHAATRDFYEWEQASGGRAYLCPYVDPRWGLARIQEAFEDLTEPPLEPMVL